MASKREFEMLFALNARMNGGFSGTFSKAQAEFTRLGKEIQSLHKVQGDISSYQKQQSAIDATRSKLENLQKQHDLIQKEIDETTGSTSGLEREKAKLEERIKNTEVALERQNQKLQTTGARLKEAGVDTENLSQKDQELTAKIKELESAQDKAADSAVSFGEKASQGITAVGDALVAAGIAVALKEVADAYMECVGIAADFQEAMSTVEALSQANAQEMAALTAEAKDLGATTKFTAKQSADAMSYMAMAGWDSTDMLQGMDGVLQLAAAAGEDLAMVSDIVTDSLSAFGLTAKDTAHFSDVLAAAATSSNTKVSIMGETFKMSASVAGALGYSIEDVATAMGLMANSGVKGSIAGTALRNTFNGLMEGVTLTGAAFGEYEYCAVRANGTMKDFGDTINELRGYFEQMTEAERVNNAMAIAGERGYNGLLAILNATDADYASLTNSINNCTGAAQRMANVRLNNLNGQLTLMDSAWDALKTTIGEEFNPELRDLAEIGTDVLGWINGFVQENPALVKGVMAATGAAGGLALGITGVTAAMKLASVASGVFAGTMGVALGPVLGVTAAIAGVVGAVTAFATAVDDGVPSVRELTETARDMQDAMDEAAVSYDKTVTSTLAAANVADTYVSKLEKMGDYTRLSKAEQEQYHNTLVLLTQVVPELADSIDLENNAIEGGTDALRANTEAWKQNAMVQAYQDQLTAMYAAQAEVLLDAEGKSIKLTQAQTRLETAEENRNAALERMNEINEIGIGDNQELLQEYWQLENAVIGYNDEIYTAQKEINNLNEAIAANSEAVAAAEEEIELAERAYRNLTGVTEEQTEAEEEAARQAQELQGVIGDTAEQVAALVEAYNDAYAAALESMQGQYALWDKADNVVATSASSVNEALQSQAEYWRSYNANLQTLMENAGDIEGLNEMLSSLDAGDAETVNFVAGLAEAAINDKQSLKDMIKNWQDAKKEQESAASSFAEYVEDIQGQIGELKDGLVEDIEDMNLSSEAASAARATIQAYIDEANNMLPQVKSFYRDFARAVSSSLGPPSFSNSAYYANSNRGYATGTDSAEPGWAMVGENGPELMFFNGGEKVLNAYETASLQANATPAASAMLAPQVNNSMAPVSVTFQIGGDATPEVVQDLHSFADEIVERVMDAFENAQADAARGAFK